MTSGLHKWPFEFLMSNKLVETIEDEFAKVSYHLTASVERSGFGTSKMKSRKDILLLRTEWSDMALANNALRDTSVNIERHLKSCDAFICLEKTTASSGTDIAVDLTLSPLIKNVHLESISAVLSERRIYRLPEFQARRHEFTDQDLQLKRTIDISEFATIGEAQSVTESDLRRALSSYYAQVPLSGSPFQQRLIFTLPNCLRTNHSTTFSEIDFKHYLKLDVVLSRPPTAEEVCAAPEEKHVSFDRIRLDIPMTILDCRLKEDFGTLPTYQAAIMDHKLEDETEVQGFQCPCFVAFRKTQKKCANPQHIPGSHHAPEVETYPAHSPPHYDRLEGMRRFESLQSSLSQVSSVSPVSP